MDNGPGSSTGGFLACPICHKQFATRSSCQRHSRQCLERTISSPRQKSCRQCSGAKTQCDKRRPSCTRCSTRNVPCEYVTATFQRSREQSSLRDSSTTTSNDALNSEAAFDGPESMSLNNNLTSLSYNDQIETSRSNTLASEIISDHIHQNVTPESEPSLPQDQTTIQQDRHPNAPGAITVDPTSEYNNPTPPAEASQDIARLRDRWLYPYVEASPARIAVMKQSMSFLCRIFRTYPRMMARGREHLPPFMHVTQISGEKIPVPLANCFVLCKMWSGNTPTEGGESLVEATIRREMDRLFSEYRTYDSPNLVASFQALLIYSIVLLFPYPQKPSSGIFDLSALASLQELGYFISQTNLVLPAEKNHVRPSWEDWVSICCIRRTLMALYCFEWFYAMLNKLPTYPCTELGFMPAPAGKVLWNARTGEEWSHAYDRWLGYWAGMRFYRMEELENIKPGPELDLRSEMWLEEADEFGTMYMALVNATEGPNVQEAD